MTLSVPRIYSVSGRWLMNVEQLVKRELTGQTNVLREKLPQCHFVHHKSHMT
jgi:hypothetical protein